MFKKFFKKKDEKTDTNSSILIAALLIHAAKIDDNYTDKEKKIIKKAVMDLNQIKLMDDERIYGAILGKSIYENKINLQDSIKEFENVS